MLFISFACITSSICKSGRTLSFNGPYKALHPRSETTFPFTQKRNSPCFKFIFVFFSVNGGKNCAKNFLYINLQILISSSLISDKIGVFEVGSKASWDSFATSVSFTTCLSFKILSTEVIYFKKGARSEKTVIFFSISGNSFAFSEDT